jgi:hypothetical protein
VSKNVSTLVAITTLGAGLIHLAVGAGAPFILLLIFVATGVAHMGWAVATLRADRIPAPTLFVAIALFPVAVWATTLVIGSAAALPLGPLAASSVLDFAAAAVVVAGLRTRKAGTVAASAAATAARARSTDTSTEHPWRFIGTLAASAAIVAGIVTPALSGTWAGQFAQPHGSHDVPALEIDEHAGH